MGLSDPVIRGFAVICTSCNMAFPAPRRWIFYKRTNSAPSPSTVAQTGIAHRRAQGRDHLVQTAAARTFVGHLPFDPFGHQFVTGRVLWKYGPAEPLAIGADVPCRESFLKLAAPDTSHSRGFVLSAIIRAYHGARRQPSRRWLWQNHRKNF